MSDKLAEWFSGLDPCPFIMAGENILVSRTPCGLVSGYGKYVICAEVLATGPGKVMDVFDLNTGKLAVREMPVNQGDQILMLASAGVPLEIINTDFFKKLEQQENSSGVDFNFRRLFIIKDTDVLSRVDA